MFLSPAFAAEVKSTVTILVVDYMGNRIPTRLERFTLKGTSVEYGSHFKELKSTEIPLGEYDFVLRRDWPGASSDGIWGRVSINELEQVVLQVAEREPSKIAVDYGPYYLFPFRIDPLPDPARSGDPIRVRLSGLVTSSQEDAIVDAASGEFQIHSWIIKGPFVVTVMQGDQVLGIKLIALHDLFPQKPIVIKLSEDAPAVLHLRPGK